MEPHEEEEGDHYQVSSGKDCMGGQVAKQGYWLLLRGEIYDGCRVEDQRVGGREVGKVGALWEEYGNSCIW